MILCNGEPWQAAIKLAGESVGRGREACDFLENRRVQLFYFHTSGLLCHMLNYMEQPHIFGDAANISISVLAFLVAAVWEVALAGLDSLTLIFRLPARPCTCRHDAQREGLQLIAKVSRDTDHVPLLFLCVGLEAARIVVSVAWQFAVYARSVRAFCGEVAVHLHI